MPIPKKWSQFNKENVRKVPKKPGAYELASSNKNIIDIGGSDKNIQSRLSKKLGTRPSAQLFRYQPSKSGIKKEAQQAQKFKEQEDRKPKYTKRSPK